MNIKNNIYCKSALTSEQLNARKKLNKTGIELQLLGDFQDTPLTTSEYISIIGDNISDIKAIHVPLKKNEEVVEIQMLNDYAIRDLFERVCEIAEAISNINKNKMLIVIHNRWSLEDYKNCNNDTESIIKFLKYLLDKYPSIKIGIENVVSYIPHSKTFSNGSLPNYVDVVKFFRNELKTDRIGSVLDTCHAIASLRILNLMENIESLDLGINLEDFFKVNKNICFLIHLANVDGLGFNKGTHGIGFENDKDILSEIIKLYNKYLCEVPITLEVMENNYIDCLTYVENYKLLLNYINKL